MRLFLIIYMKAPWKMKSKMMQPDQVVLPTISTIKQLSQGYIASSRPAIDAYHNHTVRSCWKQNNEESIVSCQEKALILCLISSCANRPGRIPDPGDGISCLIGGTSASDSFRQLNGLLVKKVSHCRGQFIICPC